MFGLGLSRLLPLKPRAALIRFITDIREGRRLNTFPERSSGPFQGTAELTTPSGAGQDRKTVEIELLGAVTLDSAIFNPVRRHIVAQGSLAAEVKLADVKVSSSSGRRFSQSHMKRLPAKDGRRRWQFQAPCSGLEDGEALVARLDIANESAVRVIGTEDTAAFARLSKGAGPARSEAPEPDENATAALTNAEAVRQADYASSELKTQPGTIAYFPPFTNSAELTNHFHRAAWYLTGDATSVGRVTLGVASSGLKVGEKPAYFGTPKADIGHIVLSGLKDDYYQALCQARLIFVWQALPETVIMRLRRLAPGAQVVTVGTNDLESTEYGNYCRAQWLILDKPDREALLAEGHAKFQAKLSELRAAGKQAAAVFGTGPSVEKALDYDFSQCVTIACNTAVADEDLLNHIQPAFLCAGDVVSHFGVSAYAERFRTDLVRVLHERDVLFFTSAAFGFLLSVKFPHIRDKIIFCDQRHQGANIDLDAVWSLPKLDSTLNIHMLPIAATFSDLVFIVGCDGKNPDPAQNEDFWAHSSRTHYHDLVDTGHLSHPTFDARRQTSTFSRYVDSTEESCQAGELEGKRYFSLEPSFTPALKARPIPGHFLKKVNGKKQLTRHSQANLPVAARPLRLLIVSKCPPHLFSGGRYHAAMIAEALAQRGHEIVLWMDNKPYWWSYLALNPNHERISFWLNDFDQDPEGPFDIVFVIPDSSSDPKAYLAALNCAQFNTAKVVLMNYEAPNWYNSLSPEPRDPALWTFWYATAKFSDAIMSSAKESTRFALEYYQQRQPHLQFVEAPPAINTYAAEVAASRDIEPQDQVICISRFGSFSKHKNIDAIIRIIPPEMKGYTLALVVGTAPLPDLEVLEIFENKLSRKGVKLKLLHGISDVEKFEEIARSKLMVFQSSFEGFGYPPIEAQYMGRPCVAFDLPVLREFSDGNIDFIKCGDYRSFRETVGRILRDFSVRKYTALKLAIAPVATVSGFADRLQIILENLMAVPELAVEAYDEGAFRAVGDGYVDGIKRVAEQAPTGAKKPETVQKLRRQITVRRPRTKWRSVL